LMVGVALGRSAAFDFFAHLYIDSWLSSLLLRKAEYMAVLCQEIDVSSILLILPSISPLFCLLVRSMLFLFRYRLILVFFIWIALFAKAWPSLKFTTFELHHWSID
jgi:hypothetical protein